MLRLDDISIESKRALSQDAPDLAEQVMAFAGSDRAMRDVLQDYDVVCRQMDAAQNRSEPDAELPRIRAELIAEMRRAVLRRAQISPVSSCDAKQED